MNIVKNEIHIYRINLKKFDNCIDEPAVLLSADEISKAGNYKFEKDRFTYTACRKFLRKILSGYVSESPDMINFSYSEHGKPFLRDSPVKFNLAHSNFQVVYAVSIDTEVGIDIEYKKKIPDAFHIAERFFSQYEKDDLKKVAGEKTEEVFYNCWTRKEAFIKATGKGLSMPLDEFSVSILPGEKPELLWLKSNPEDVKEWSLFDIHVSTDYKASLAVRKKGLRITYKDDFNIPRKII